MTHIIRKGADMGICSSKVVGEANYGLKAKELPPNYMLIGKRKGREYFDTPSVLVVDARRGISSNAGRSPALPKDVSMSNPSDGGRDLSSLTLLDWDNNEFSSRAT